MQGGYFPVPREAEGWGSVVGTDARRCPVSSCACTCFSFRKLRWDFQQAGIYCHSVPVPCALPPHPRGVTAVVQAGQQTPSEHSANTQRAPSKHLVNTQQTPSTHPAHLLYGVAALACPRAALLCSPSYLRGVF